MMPITTTPSVMTLANLSKLSAELKIERLCVNMKSL